MYVRSLIKETDLTKGAVYRLWDFENDGTSNPEADGDCYVIDDAGQCHLLFESEYEIINDKTPALTSTTHVLKIEHKFKVTKTIDSTVQLELQHGVYSKDNVQELIDILLKVKEEM